MIEECVILGGGVAGLSAANRLIDRGVTPLIIDGGQYPAHRVCGEFFSHECLPILEDWGVTGFFPIEKSRFYANGHHFEFKLPKSSGGLSRYDFDIQLLERAVKKGARALIGKEVKAIHSGEVYTIELSDGETIKARHLMIGTGRIPKMTKPLEPQYVGFKAHFEGIKNDAVEIHALDGGYLGISNVDEKTTNIACLMHKNGEAPDAFIKNRFPEAKMLFPKWMTGRLPEFGIRDTPNMERVFWIGDAAGSIPPVCGEGLAIAVTSGCMAADYYLDYDSQAFKNDWLKRYRKRFYVAKQLHYVITKPFLASTAVLTCKIIPPLPILIWKLTRE